jgi:hypothetical protein
MANWKVAAPNRRDVAYRPSRADNRGSAGQASEALFGADKRAG